MEQYSTVILLSDVNHDGFDEKKILKSEVKILAIYIYSHLIYVPPRKL